MLHRKAGSALAVAAAFVAAGLTAQAQAQEAKKDADTADSRLEKLLKGFYGTLDVSIDDVTKGMDGMVAYHLTTDAQGNPILDYAHPKSGGAGPVGRVGYMPALSSNKSNLGYRGEHKVGGSDLAVIYQIEVSLALVATPGLRTSYTQQGNTVTGTVGSGDTFVGLKGSWGTLKAGVTYAPYKKSTDRMNPFSGMLGDYAVVMGNTGGDNRVEFGTRLDHSLWYESPRYEGFSYDVLVSPGQNRTYDNVVQSAGSPDCNGGNAPGSGNLLLNCDDGGFDNAFSLALKYETKNLYVTAAYELHKNVNRNSDGIGSNNPYYGVDQSTLNLAYSTYIPSQFTGVAPDGTPFTGPQVGNWLGSPPYLNDIGDEAAAKVGVQYIFDATGTTVSAIFEHMTRKLPANLAFQNERQRNGTWLAASQAVGGDGTVSLGWAHAGKTPGDPGGQHNYNPAATNNTANMFTVAYKQKLDKQLAWYVNFAETINTANAHYDLGAGGRGLTTDCHDGTNFVYVDYSSAGPTTWGGCKPRGVTVGINYKF